MSGSGSWSVVSIVNEKPEILRRFVTWNLWQGAERLHLYFDNPEDPAIEMLEPLGDRIVATRCTPEFWKSIGADQSWRFTARQVAVIKHGYEQVESDWVANIDGDELFYFPERSTISVLEEMPPEVRGFSVSTAEYVFTHEPTNPHTFRRSGNERRINKIYGDFAPFIAPNHGLIGHFIGKSFTRSGIDIRRAHQHWFINQDNKRILNLGLGWSDDAYLLHFYAPDYEDWRRKIEYRARSAPRGKRNLILEAIRELLNSGDEAGLKQMYERMHSLTARQHHMLKKRGMLFELDVDLEEIEGMYFPVKVPAK